MVSGGASFAGYLIDLAIMQVRLALHDISEEELNQFSNALSDGLLEKNSRSARVSSVANGTRRVPCRQARIDGPDGKSAMPDRRWIILAILFAARAATGFQFQSVGSISNMLIQDLGLSYAQIGLLLGAYLLPGIVVAFPAGVLGQRVQAKSLGLAGLALMTVSGLALEHADHFAVALVARIDRRRRRHHRGAGRHENGDRTGSTVVKSCWRCRSCR